MLFVCSQPARVGLLLALAVCLLATASAKPWGRAKAAPNPPPTIYAYYPGGAAPAPAPVQLPPVVQAPSPQTRSLHRQIKSLLQKHHHGHNNHQNQPPQQPQVQSTYQVASGSNFFHQHHHQQQQQQQFQPQVPVHVQQGQQHDGGKLAHLSALPVVGRFFYDPTQKELAKAMKKEEELLKQSAKNLHEATVVAPEVKVGRKKIKLATNDMVNQSNQVESHKGNVEYYRSLLKNREH